MDKRLLVLASGMFAVGTDSFVVAGVLHQVSASFGVSVALAGQMVTLYALSYAALSPVIAAAAAHWPRRRLLLSGLAVFVLGNLTSALALSIEVVLMSRARRRGSGHVQSDGDGRGRIPGIAGAAWSGARHRYRRPVQRDCARRPAGHVHRRLARLASDDVVRRRGRRAGCDRRGAVSARRSDAATH